MTLKFHVSVANGFILKFRMFLGLISTFVEVTREKLVGGLPPIMNRVRDDTTQNYHKKVTQQ